MIVVDMGKFGILILFVQNKSVNDDNNEVLAT